MPSLPNSTLESIAEAHFALASNQAFRRLSAHVDEQVNRAPDEIAADLADIEANARELLKRLGSEITPATLARLDVRANGIVVNGKAESHRLLGALPG
ncbi:MAG: hypothetical protein HYV63_12390 [Candidatus Schekmanbacteria bacterium]|nr:hypothetical protein [Candidatus Schekmanbacteria bacterium]